MELIELYKNMIDRVRRHAAAIMNLTIPGATGGLEAAPGILEIDPSAMLIVSRGYSNDAVMAKLSELLFC